jgi:hypothetical protein
MIGFGILQILLSQIPNFHKLTLLSTVAAITSFGYALIGSGLSLAVVVSGIIFITYIFLKDYFQHQFHHKLVTGLATHSETIYIASVTKSFANIGR